MGRGGGAGAGRAARDRGTSGAGSGGAAGSFHGSVQASVNSAPSSAGFGPRRVFIGEAYDRWPGKGSMSLGEFKGRLLAEHKAGRLALGRADLVAAMDPAKVARSLTRHPLGAEYHFIERKK